MKERLYLKVKPPGNVLGVNEAGNPRRFYYNKGDAVRAYWSDMGDGYVEVYLENGKILILNQGGNIVRTI